VFFLNAIRPELSDSLNPLDMVRLGTYHEADDALELAKLLVIPESSEGHWDTRATQLLQALILYVCLRYRETPELRNLAKVRSLVALGAKGLEPVMAEAATLGPVSLRDLATGFQGMGDMPEAKSIISNADKAMTLWAADRPAGLVSMESAFRFEDFNRRTMTCYLMVDEEKLPIYAGFLRVMMGCALMAMTRAKEEAPPKVPTLLLLDEAAALGRIEPLETGVGYLATYARLLFVFQDLDQLNRTYPKARSIMANAGVKIAFGINDVETARMLSDTLGPVTTASRSTGESFRSLDPAAAQRSQGTSEAGRALLDLSEILRLPRDRAIILFNGPVRFPVLARKVRYFKERRWRGQWDRWRSQAQVVELRPKEQRDNVVAL
jgi:type IV secretion system protein VirD4